MSQEQGPPPAAQTPAATELQRLTAIAQHQLNNPLAALLAESQLLAADPALGNEQREAVDRMIAIVRRIILLVRELEQAVKERDRG
jgi:signal transduction histidine kinase